VQAPLGEQLLHVTVGKREAQVPADRKQNYLRFKLAPLEQTGLDEEHPSILAASLSGRASKVATLPWIMNTAKVSTRAQNEVIRINREHRETGLFELKVMTWDAIEILLHEYPDVR
jgi:hypothetical protein